MFKDKELDSLAMIISSNIPLHYDVGYHVSIPFTLANLLAEVVEPNFEEGHASSPNFWIVQHLGRDHAAHLLKTLLHEHLAEHPDNMGPNSIFLQRVSYAVIEMMTDKDFQYAAKHNLSSLLLGPIEKSERLQRLYRGDKMLFDLLRTGHHLMILLKHKQDIVFNNIVELVAKKAFAWRTLFDITVDDATINSGDLFYVYNVDTFQTQKLLFQKETLASFANAWTPWAGHVLISHRKCVHAWRVLATQGCIDPLKFDLIVANAKNEILCRNFKGVPENIVRFLDTCSLWHLQQHAAFTKDARRPTMAARKTIADGTFDYDP